MEQQQQENSEHGDSKDEYSDSDPSESEEGDEEDVEVSDPEDEPADLFAHPLPDLGKVSPPGQKVWLRGVSRLPKRPYPLKDIVVTVDGDK